MVCAALAVILALVFIGLWKKGGRPTQEKPLEKHETEEEAKEEMPIETTEPEKEEQPERSGNPQRTDNPQRTENPGGNRNLEPAEENIPKEPDSGEKPIELPFIPAD